MKRFRLVLLGCLLAAGCTQGELSALSPAGPGSQGIAHIWWVMLIGFGIVYLGVMALAVYAIWGRKRGPAPVRTLLVGGGLALPTVAVLALLIYGIESGKSLLPVPLPSGQQAYRVNVRGHQWWWEIEHVAQEGVVKTVNEIHIPTGTPVDIHVSSNDVIHSFWAPRLGGKIDAIPGRTNVIRLQANASGQYHGVCGEFCGARHAHMKLVIHAHEPEGLRRWLSVQTITSHQASRPDPTLGPTTSNEAAGQAVTPGHAVASRAATSRAAVSRHVTPAFQPEGPP